MLRIPPLKLSSEHHSHFLVPAFMGKFCDSECIEADIHDRGARARDCQGICWPQKFPGCVLHFADTCGFNGDLLIGGHGLCLMMIDQVVARRGHGRV